MSMTLAVLFLLMTAIVIKKTNGACCNSKRGYCGDCTRGTPRCGYFSCNIFGCACGGGCRKPPKGQICYFTFDGKCKCSRKGRKKRSTEATAAVVIFNIYDLNKNGKIEMMEFAEAFNYTGLTEEELYVHWVKMDENKDNFITIEEMDNDKL